MPRVADDTPKELRPFLFHRLELSWGGSSEANGDCIFCGRDKKFYVNVETGKWNCRICGKSGNAITFLRELHKNSPTSKEHYDEVIEDRKLKYETLARWGLVQSLVDQEWMLPTYTPKNGTDSAINNLYRWSSPKMGAKRVLLCTSGFEHGLFGMQFYDPNKPDLDLLEGPWNAMAWEEEHLKTTSGKTRLRQTNILGLGGATTFKDSWLKYFQAKNVFLAFDSDHPKRSCIDCKKSYSLVTHRHCPSCGKTEGRNVEPAGYNGLKGVTKKLKSTVASLHVLRWGEEGYDPTKPSGYDIRDFLKRDSTTADT